MFLADITAVRVDEDYVDANGRLCMERCHLAAYIHGAYYSIGQALGTFGFSVKKKQKKRKSS